MKSQEKFQKLPNRLKSIVIFFQKMRLPAKVVYLLISILATIWFLIRVIPKPSRATYPCMQVAAPIMSGFVIWILALSGATFAFKKAKHKLIEAKYLAAGLFLIIGIAATSVFYSTISQRNQSRQSRYLVQAKYPAWRGKRDASGSCCLGSQRQNRFVGRENRILVGRSFQQPGRNRQTSGTRQLFTLTDLQDEKAS